MKTVNNLFQAISNKQMENLTQVVNETLAVSKNQQPATTFSAADLWKIQRDRKIRIGRRMFA
ncbi:MAG: hypothetical protein ACOVNR_03010 [Chitinophagaceae bacterium]